MKKEMITRSKVVNGFLWRLAERIGAQGVTFVVSIVLARLLDPKVYGTIALVTVFTTIMNVFTDAGLANALIQKKDADDIDFSSVFWINILWSCLLYLIMFFAAPLIAAFYHDDSLTPIVRVMSLSIVVSGVKNVQQAYISRTLQFRKFFFATLGGTVAAAVLGIYMAYMGYGVWALIIQYLTNTTMDTIILWLTVNWRPKRVFSWERLRGLLSYGWKLLVSALLDTTYENVRQLVIGKLYTSEDLAYYNRGMQFPSLIINNIDASINSVLLPTMSSEQEDRRAVKDITRRAIKTSTYIIMPLMMGLAVCGEPIVRLLLTEKWLPSVFFMRIFCFSFAFYPMHTANLNAIKAIGRSGLFLKLEIIKKIIGITVLAITMFISVKAMAIGTIATTIISLIINSWPNRNLLNYSFREQIMDMMPQILLTCGMGIIVYGITLLHLNDWFTLGIQVISGITFYVRGSRLFHMDSLEYVTGMMKHYLMRIKK